MFFPVSTDAPLYHRPIVTIGLILANVVTFIITGGGSNIDGWLLRFGNGLHPSEWIASAFLHFGLMHLIGNAIFLWAYGLIIEGKIGHFRFLTLYIVLALLDGCLTQSLMLYADGPRGAGGASGVIFALMGIALIWAPENEFEVVWMYGIGMFVRTGTCQLSVLFLSAFHMVVNFIQAAFISFEMSTPVLHLMGAVIGLPIGLLFLQKNWVDCEGWDILSIWRGDNFQGGIPLSQWKRSEDLPLNDKQPPRHRQKSVMSIHKEIEELILRKQHSLASELYFNHRDKLLPSHQLSKAGYRSLIEWLRLQRSWKHLAALLEDYLLQSRDDAERARLMLAQIYVDKLSRPKAGLRTLAELSEDVLSEKEIRYFRTISRQANSQIANGTLEIADHRIA